MNSQRITQYPDPLRLENSIYSHEPVHLAVPEILQAAGNKFCNKLKIINLPPEGACSRGCPTERLNINISLRSGLSFSK